MSRAAVDWLVGAAGVVVVGVTLGPPVVFVVWHVAVRGLQWAGGA